MVSSDITILGWWLQTDDDVIKLDGSEISRACILWDRTWGCHYPASYKEGKKSRKEGDE